MNVADQLLIPAAFNRSAISYATNRITQHLLTNAEIISKFVETNIEINGAPGGFGIVKIHK